MDLIPIGMRPSLQVRSTPIDLHPPKFDFLVDRKEQIKDALEALRSKHKPQIVEFYGQEGVGKSVLLRHLAYDPLIISLFSDKLCYLPANSSSVTDLLQKLCDAFCESNVPFKPTDGQIRHTLKNTKALILLDNVDIKRETLEELFLFLPSFTFILASTHRKVWGEGCSIPLVGLPLDDAIILVRRELERELHRDLRPDEYVAAKDLCIALNCHPLHILQATARVREEGLSLIKVAQMVQSTSPSKALHWQILMSLTPSQRLILEMMTALGVWFLPERVAALVNLSNADIILESLLRRNLIETDGLHYRVTKTVSDTLEQVQNLTPLRDQALCYLTSWIEQHQFVHNSILEEADTILWVLRQTVAASRWRQAMHLCRIVESSFAFSRRWGLWVQVLEYALQAARSLNDKTTEAWALHQLGSCALCCEDINLARKLLTQSLRLRESSRDEAGIHLTRNNLKLIPPIIHRIPTLLPTVEPKTIPALFQTISSFILPVRGLLSYGILMVISALFHQLVGIPLLLKLLNSTRPTNTEIPVAIITFNKYASNSTKSTFFPRSKLHKASLPSQTNTPFPITPSFDFSSIGQSPVPFTPSPFVTFSANPSPTTNFTTPSKNNYNSVIVQELAKFQLILAQEKFDASQAELTRIEQQLLDLRSRFVDDAPQVRSVQEKLKSVVEAFRLAEAELKETKIEVEEAQKPTVLLKINSNLEIAQALARYTVLAKSRLDLASKQLTEAEERLKESNIESLHMTYSANASTADIKQKKEIRRLVLQDAKDAKMKFEQAESELKILESLDKSYIPGVDLLRQGRR